LIQSCHRELSDFDNSRLLELASLGKRRGRCDVNRPKKTISGSCWCIVCLIWLGDEALNALKIWPSEQLSSGKGRR